MNAQKAALILADGDVPALVAAAIEAEKRVGATEGPAPVLWCCPIGPGPMTAQSEAVDRQARILGLDIEAPTPALWTVRDHFEESLLTILARATQIAGQRGLERIVWPAISPPSDDDYPSIAQMAAIVDVSEGLSRVIDAVSRYETSAERHLEIDIPFFDLADRQVADLFNDFALPATACWWDASSGGSGAEAAIASERWLAAGVETEHGRNNPALGEGRSAARAGDALDHRYTPGHVDTNV